MFVYLIVDGWVFMGSISNRILKGVVIPLIFPNVPKSSLGILRVPGTLKNPIVSLKLILTFGMTGWLEELVDLVPLIMAGQRTPP